MTLPEPPAVNVRVFAELIGIRFMTLPLVFVTEIEPPFVLPDELVVIVPVTPLGTALPLPIKNVEVLLELRVTVPPAPVPVAFAVRLPVTFIVVPAFRLIAP